MARIFLVFLATVIVIRSEVPVFTKVGAFPTASVTLNAGTYDNGKFVVVGNNIILYSTDEGATWREAEGYPAIKFRSVICGNGRFLAVGEGSDCGVSDDGVHWKTYPLTSGGNVQYTLASLAYGNGTFAVAGLMRFPNETASAGGTSSDGIQWSFPIKNIGTSVAFLNSRGFLFSDQVFSKVPQSADGLPLAGSGSPLVGGDGTAAAIICIYGNPTGLRTTRLLRSTDGESWGEIGFSRTTFNGLFPSGTRALAVQAGPRGLFDPINFSGQDLGPSYGVNGADAYALSSNTVVALSVGPIRHRPLDSSSWIPSETPNLVLTSSTASSNVFVAVGRTNGAANSQPQILVATNGLPYATTIPTTDPLNVVRTGGGVFVAVGSGGTILRSFDGVNWVRRLSNTTSELFDATRGGNGLWVAVGADGKIVTSSDTSFFSLRFSGTGVPIFGVASSSNQFVGVGKDGLIVTSSNGVDWSARGTDEAATLYSVAYGNNRFVAVGTNGFTHTSIDGVNWSATQINGVSGFRRVAFSNGTFVGLTSTNNIIYASRDGVTWDSRQISAFSLYGLDASDGELWLVGDRSTILRTSLSPVRAPSVRAGLDQSKKFVLTVQPVEPANYLIQSVLH